MSMSSCQCSLARKDKAMARLPQAGKSSLEALLKKVMKDLGKKGRLTEEEMAEIWTSAAGPAAAGHSKVKSLRKGMLFVTVDDSSWLYELTLKKREITERLKPKIRTRNFKDIRFRIGILKDKNEKDVKNGREG